MTPYEVQQLLQQSYNQNVELTLTDGRKYTGNIVNVDHEKITLETRANADNQDERFFPFISIPLAFIAGAAVGHHHYPYPYPYPYPYTAYPYSPYAYPYYPYYPYYR